MDAGGRKIDHLGDIGRVVAHALQILGNEQQMRRLADARRIFHHVGDERAEQAVVEIIDRAVGLGDADRRFGIACGKGIEHVMHHPAGEIGHRREDRQRLNVAVIVDGGDAARDIFGIIADPLDDARDFQRRDDFAQIVGERGAQRDQFDREPFDFMFNLVDLAITRDHAVGGVEVVPLERFHRLDNRLFGKSAHLRNQAAQPPDVFVKCLNCVINQLKSRFLFDQP